MRGWFSLEVVYAKKGDALILHYGNKSRPRRILIDGGHTGVYEAFLRPRLDELRLASPAECLDRENRLKLEMVMVSHADADHLEGILDLTAHMVSEDSPQAPVIFDELWFNGFEDLIAGSRASGASIANSAPVLDRLARTAGFDEDDDLPIPAAMRVDKDVRAVVASTRQGRRLLQDASKLRIGVNSAYGNDLVMRGGDRSPVTRLVGHLELTVLGPDKPRIDRLRRKWKADLRSILAQEEAAAKATSFADSSPFNLASLMVLARRGRHKMLLTGDGRGKELLEGLAAAELLDASGKIHVDLFKLPHHGSDRNVKCETFRDITADHYVISANGEHANPDTTTLDMLALGRARSRSDPYTVHLSFPKEAFRLISEEAADKKAKVRAQKTALEEIDTWLNTKRPDEMKVVYREGSRRSLAIDLGTEKVFG